MKICSKCKEEKTLDSFSKMKASIDCLQNKCKDCDKEYRKDNAIKIKDYRDNNKDKFYQSYLRNKEAVHERGRKYKHTNKDRVYRQQSAYKKLNPEIVHASNTKRRLSKTNAIPTWLTEEQKSKIDNLYWLASDLKAVTGESYHVDHIVPLQGKNVCGLHVPWNLQILPADINLAKSNKHVA